MLAGLTEAQIPNIAATVYAICNCCQCPPEDRDHFKERFHAFASGKETSPCPLTGTTGKVCTTNAAWIATAYSCNFVHQLQCAADMFPFSRMESCFLSKNYSRCNNSICTFSSPENLSRPSGFNHNSCISLYKSKMIPSGISFSLLSSSGSSLLLQAEKNHHQTSYQSCHQALYRFSHQLVGQLLKHA
jgi:hypothetical protein